MSRAGFWRKDWFLGLVVAAVLFLLGPSDLLQSLERKAYDIGVRATDRTRSERVAVIAIDVSVASKTKTGMVLATPSYTSPEQLAFKRIDGRSDLFSLAVSLYQLACGRLPFEGESMAQLMYRIANEAPPSILEHNPAVPPGVVAFLQRALAKDADARFESVAAFAVALLAATGGAVRAVAPSVDLSL